MRERYITQNVKAEAQTDKAFCCTGELVTDMEGSTTKVKDFWIPLSQIHEEDHDEIEEACRGDVVEIHISQWWLEQQF